MTESQNSDDTERVNDGLVDSAFKMSQVVVEAQVSRSSVRS